MTAFETISQSSQQSHLSRRFGCVACGSCSTGSLLVLYQYISVPNSSSMVKTTGPRPRYLAECFQDMEQEVYLNSGIAIPRLQGGRRVLKFKQFHKTAPCQTAFAAFLALHPTRTTHSVPFPARYTCATIWAYRDSRYRSDPHSNLFTHINISTSQILINTHKYARSNQDLVPKLKVNRPWGYDSFILSVISVASPPSLGPAPKGSEFVLCWKDPHGWDSLDEVWDQP